MTVLGIKALVFYTFGTVVDWRTSVAADMAAFFGRRASIATGSPSPTPGAAAITRRWSGHWRS